MKVKLAEALLRRKELQEKVDRLRPLNNKDLYETRSGRTKVTDSLDDVIVQVSKVSFQQFTHTYDWHAKQLRLVDAAIQQANWTAELEFESPDVMGDYIDPYVKDEG